MNNLFVYGTLALGKKNSHILESINGSWAKGYVRGKLINKGWGAKHGSPGIILDIEAQEVEGFVFTSDNLSKNIVFLDKFEGAEYKRVITEVRLEDNAIINSYIYQLQIEDKAY